MLFLSDQVTWAILREVFEEGSDGIISQTRLLAGLPLDGLFIALGTYYEFYNANFKATSKPEDRPANFL